MATIGRASRARENWGGVYYSIARGSSALRSSALGALTNNNSELGVRKVPLPTTTEISPDGTTKTQDLVSVSLFLSPAGIIKVKQSFQFAPNPVSRISTVSLS